MGAEGRVAPFKAVHLPFAAREQKERPDCALEFYGLELCCLSF